MDELGETRTIRGRGLSVSSVHSAFFVLKVLTLPTPVLSIRRRLNFLNEWKEKHPKCAGQQEEDRDRLDCT